MNKEQIFDQAAQAYMAKFILSDFKMTHPRLFKAIMEAMDNVNQPPKSAEVKSPKEYLDEHAIFGDLDFETYTEESALNALAAQAKDFEDSLRNIMRLVKMVCEDIETGTYENGSVSFEELSCAIIEIEDPDTFKNDLLPESFTEEDMMDFGAMCVGNEHKHHAHWIARTPVEDLLTQFRNQKPRG